MRIKNTCISLIISQVITCRYLKTSTGRLFLSLAARHSSPRSMRHKLRRIQALNRCDSVGIISRCICIQRIFKNVGSFGQIVEVEIHRRIANRLIINRLLRPTDSRQGFRRLKTRCAQVFQQYVFKITIGTHY